jgi:hypothetical protein
VDEKRSKGFDPGDAVSIARLFQVAEAADTSWWCKEDLNAILQHQLDVPLSFDRGQTAGAENGGNPDQSMAQTFRDLLSSDQPSLELLQRLKEFAKSSDTRVQNPLPTPVALVLYYWAIVAARMRCEVKISRMSDADLRRGIAWITHQAWLDKSTRQFFGTALNALMQ